MKFPINEIGYPDFPPLIREIPDPPEKLYYRGTLPHFEHKWLCVVGSRKFSPYGRDVCTHLIESLRGYPVVIVSGLALGMDGIAHESALRAHLPTIAVPGSGLDDRVIYPRTHFPLAMRILESGGTLLSEFEPSWKPRIESFPQRNRIMAGLCHATLIIEARERAGTQITARLATEYNRDVLTVPHSIFSETGHGPHRLMRLGATPIRNSEDLLEALDIDPRVTDPVLPPLSEQEERVVAFLKIPIPRDALIRSLGMPTHKANTLLSEMELKGIIGEENGLLTLV